MKDSVDTTNIRNVYREGFDWEMMEPLCIPEGKMRVIVKAVLPVYTGYEISDELFTSLCSLLGVSLTYGLRRALPVVAACLIPLGTIQCGPSLCEKVAIEIVNHPELTSPPAGKVLIKCDGKLKAELLGKKVTK